MVGPNSSLSQILLWIVGYTHPQVTCHSSSSMAIFQSFKCLPGKLGFLQLTIDSINSARPRKIPRLHLNSLLRKWNTSMTTVYQKLWSSRRETVSTLNENITQRGNPQASLLHDAMVCIRYWKRSASSTTDSSWHQRTNITQCYIDWLQPGKAATTVPNRNFSEPPLIIIDKEAEYKVEEIQNSQVQEKKFKYYVKWKGYSDLERSWEMVDNVANAKWQVNAFHQKHPRALCPVAASLFLAMNFRPINENFELVPSETLKTVADWENDCSGNFCAYAFWRKGL